jgi:Uma2 family endonuclease
MGMGAVIERWTAERVRALPDDGNRYEAIEAELYVTPAPRLIHQRIVTLMAVALAQYVEPYRLGVVVTAPADIEFADDTLVQPDISVLPLVEGRAPISWRDITSLLLVVEVLSPRTADYDRGVKRRLYLRQAVGEYWIVDPEGRFVERWTTQSAAPVRERETLEWRPSPQVPAMRLDVELLFARLSF